MAGLSYEQWINNMIRQESGGNPNALSPKGAAGIMQVMPATAREIAADLGDQDILGMDDQGITRALMDPARGRRYGEHYAQKLLKHYNGNQILASIAYNGGYKRADDFAKHSDPSRLPRETQGYAKAIHGADVFGGGGNYQGMLSGGAGADMLAGGGGSDAMTATGSGGAGSPFEAAPWNERVGAMLYALGSIGSHDGGEAQAIDRLRAINNRGVNENKTYQALIARGIDPATAEWAVRDPQVMREVAQQLFAPKSKNMTISEIFDPATGRPVKVLVDQTTGEYQPIGGVQAVDPTKAPNLQAIEVYDEKGGGKRKVLLNPQTGEMQPIGGVAAADAPKETAYDKEVSKERVQIASKAITGATAAKGILPLVDQLKKIGASKDGEGDAGDLARGIGGIQGYDWYQSTLGRIPGWGSPELNAQIKNISANLNAELGRVWLSGQGSASEMERKMVADAIGQLAFARDGAEFNNLVTRIEDTINRKIQEGERASKNVPGLDVTSGGAGRKLRGATESELSEARAAIEAGVDRNAVIQRLRQNGINPAGL